MPELPDVEGRRRQAEQLAVGCTVTAVSDVDPRVLRTTTAQGLGRALQGARIESTDRHGKWLWLRTDATSDLLVHFGMTGEFHEHALGEGLCDLDRAALVLDDRTRLVLHMPRLFGGLWLVRDDDESRQVTGPLGPDAVELDAVDLADLLGDRRAGLKSALMDQQRLAGLGNELVDEICWQARLHPSTTCRELSADAWEDLARAKARVLGLGVDLGQVPSPDGFLGDVRDQEDPDCPRCGVSLRRDTIAGRTTLWCPREQPTP